MPDIFVGALKGAEANADPEQTLPAPSLVGRQRDLPDAQGFAAVHQHLHGFLLVLRQKSLQRVIILVQSCISDGNDEVEEGFQSGFVSW